MENETILLSKYLEKWQDILRLRDWDIKLELVNQEWRKSGDVKIDSDARMAIVMINQFNRKATNLEALMIHELLHIKLWGMDQMIEGLIYNVFGEDETDPKFQFAYTQFMQQLETTVEDLTKAYIQAGGEETTLSYGRLLPDVEKELNSRKR